MAVFRIAVIGGDGIGPEVIDQAIRAADAAARKHDGAELKWNRLPWSTAYYKKPGRMLPEDGWDTLSKHDAILFGAVGDPDVPDTITVHELLLPMRRKFDQYVNLRPAYLFDGVPCPLRDKTPGAIDMLVYRENTEGEYAPVGGRLYAGHAARDRHADRRLHPPRLRAHHAGRLRGGPQAAAKKLTSASPSRTPRCTAWCCGTRCSTTCAKDYPDVQTQLAAGGCGRDGLRPQAGGVRRGGGEQPVRRHPDRPERHRDRQHGPGGQREHQPGADVPEHVRAGPRLAPRTSPARASPTRWRRSCRRR